MSINIKITPPKQLIQEKIGKCPDFALKRWTSVGKKPPKKALKRHQRLKKLICSLGDLISVSLEMVWSEVEEVAERKGRFPKKISRKEFHRLWHRATWRHPKLSVVRKRKKLIVCYIEWSMSDYFPAGYIRELNGLINEILNSLHTKDGKEDEFYDKYINLAGEIEKIVYSWCYAVA
jgi:hypothetical protein